MPKKISTLKPNPDNPRLIKDDKFKKLVDNVLLYPKFLKERPIVYKDNIVQGGNMRFRAIDHIVKLNTMDFEDICDRLKLSSDLVILWNGIRKSKTLPDGWTADAKDYSNEEIKAFIILDNVPFGEWDWNELANNWDHKQLNNWDVVQIPEFKESGSSGSGGKSDEESFDDEGIEGQNKFGVIVNCQNEEEQQEIFNNLVAQGLSCKIVAV